MATIQVREIPEEAYEVIRRRARARGASIQAYMRDQVIEMAATPSKSEALAAVEAALTRYGPAGATPEQVAADLAAERRG